MASPIVWIAGPVGLQKATNLILVGTATNATVAVGCRWEFIGCSERGELRRWALRFDVPTRKFTVNSLSISKWEQAHRQRLFDLYRPVALLRSDLPPRSILLALKAMLTPKEIAEVIALSMRGGVEDG